MNWAEILVNCLKRTGVSLIAYVPDISIHQVTKLMEEDPCFRVVASTREEEAIGIATGMLLSKSPSLIFLQNAGFANSLSTITSLVQLYQFPLIFLIGWRGYQKNDAPEHKKIGKIQPELIKSLGLKSRIIRDKNWKECCNWVIAESKNGHTCALIIPREFVD